MPLKYWDQAFLAATYLINRIPTKILQYSSPLKVLFNEKPDYSMLRVFGCACWPNLRPYNERKLAFRSKRCEFLGYSNMHKGFKCLDISTGRIYISRDVVFDEQVFPFAELHANAGARLRSEIDLLPSSLFDSSLSLGSTTIPRIDVVNRSFNPAANPDENPVENQLLAPVLHAVSQGGTNSPTEADPPAPATSSALGSDSGSASTAAGAPVEPTCPASAPTASASVPTGEPAAAMPPMQASPAAPHVRVGVTDATRRASTGPVDLGGSGCSTTPSGSGVAEGSGATSAPTASPVVAPQEQPQPSLRPRTRAQDGICKPK
jgi:hypothetical protein